MRIVDLRSDTITKPTPSMRTAMANAEVGDDVFGDDPTVNRLERKAAETMGKEAALFVSSGTMGNLVSQLAHCGRGDEMILGDQSHIFYYEQGGSAALGGIHPRIVPNLPDGRIGIDDIEHAVRSDDIHFPVSRLVVLENTHNRCCGTPLESGYVNEIADIAHGHGLKLHIDGARIFNAAIALNVPVLDLVEKADSVSFCLSKGLAAPAGSLVCGSREFVYKARRARKALGGGMRQAGILAAAGIVALDEMVDRLADDHANARRLAKGLADIEGLFVDPDSIKTNIVFFSVIHPGITAQALVERLEKQGVKMMSLGPGMVRAVTNYHVISDDIDHALEVIRGNMTI